MSKVQRSEALTRITDLEEVVASFLEYNRHELSRIRSAIRILDGRIHDLEVKHPKPRRWWAKLHQRLTHLSPRRSPAVGRAKRGNEPGSGPQAATHVPTPQDTSEAAGLPDPAGLSAEVPMSDWSTRARIMYAVLGALFTVLAGLWIILHDHLHPEAWSTWEHVMVYIVSGAVGLFGLGLIAGAIRGRKLW